MFSSNSLDCIILYYEIEQKDRMGLYNENRVSLPDKNKTIIEIDTS